MLRRALSVLDAFEYRDRNVSLAALARRTGLPKPTLLRILAELVDWGAVERTEGGYQLGVCIFMLEHHDHAELVAQQETAPPPPAVAAFAGWAADYRRRFGVVGPAGLDVVHPTRFLLWLATDTGSGGAVTAITPFHLVKRRRAGLRVIRLPPARAEPKPNRRRFGQRVGTTAGSDSSKKSRARKRKIAAIRLDGKVRTRVL